MQVDRKLMRQTRSFGHQPGVLKREWVAQSEDSHTVNVFVPDGTKAGDKLPVLVWIYGGSLNNGSADRFLYDPTEWIRRSAADGKRFIVVTGNHRVNVFGPFSLAACPLLLDLILGFSIGFFSSPALLAQDPSGLSGNYGLYDCVAQLEWVQRNIAAFGGDAGRVTAFGESAGAFIISHLLVSGRKLFQRAIMQSAAPETMVRLLAVFILRDLIPPSSHTFPYPIAAPPAGDTLLPRPLDPARTPRSRRLSRRGALCPSRTVHHGPPRSARFFLPLGSRLAHAGGRTACDVGPRDDAEAQGGKVGLVD